MAGRELVTRGALARRLAFNAATKPVNVATLAVLTIVGVVTQLAAIVTPIAVVAYLVLCAITFFDADEARRVGGEAYGHERREHASATPRLDDFSPSIRAELEQARRLGVAIVRAIDDADQPLDDVRADLDALLAALTASARRAQLIETTLADQASSGQGDAALARRIAALQPRAAADADVRALVTDLQAQRDGLRRLAARRERFDLGMQRLTASLALLQTRIVEMSATEGEAAQREVGALARDLRERTDLLAESLAEAFRDEDATTTGRPRPPSPAPGTTRAQPPV